MTHSGESPTSAQRKHVSSSWNGPGLLNQINSDPRAGHRHSSHSFDDNISSGTHSLVLLLAGALGDESPDLCCVPGSHSCQKLDKMRFG